MAYEEFSNRNISEGFQTLFVYTNDVTNGIFTPLILFALFIIIAMGSYFAQGRSGERPDFAISFAVAGYVVAGAAFIMLLIPNMINTFTVGVCVAVAIIGTLWLYLSNAAQ